MKLQALKQSFLGALMNRWQLAGPPTNNPGEAWLHELHDPYQPVVCEYRTSVRKMGENE
jgi:hypothetical protein